MRTGVAAMIFATTLLIACGPDATPDRPAQHGCFGTVTAPAKPEPLVTALDGDNHAAEFIGEVEPGQEIVLNAEGSIDVASLRLAGPVVNAEDLGPELLSLSLSDGSFSFTAPTAPGSYRLQATGELGPLLVGELEVVAAPVVICTSADVGPNGEITLVWSGPSNVGDEVDLFDPVSGRILQKAPADGSAWEINATTFIAPEEVGIYTARYRKADGLVQVSNDIAVTRARELGTLKVPGRAPAGKPISVQWIGPLRPGHIIRVVDTTSGNEVAAVALVDGGYGASSAILEGPRPGTYRVEYAKPESELPAASEKLVVVSGDA